MTRSAESYEAEIRYLRETCQRMNQKLQALTNTPETHDGGRPLHRDPTGNKASAQADNHRKRRN